jgi:hypothetical protein
MNSNDTMIMQYNEVGEQLFYCVHSHLSSFVSITSPYHSLLLYPSPIIIICYNHNLWICVDLFGFGDRSMTHSSITRHCSLFASCLAVLSHSCCLVIDQHLCDKPTPIYRYYIIISWVVYHRMLRYYFWALPLLHPSNQ